MSWAGTSHNTYPYTGSNISSVPSKTWASQYLHVTLACTWDTSPLKGHQSASTYMRTTLSTLENLTDQKNISEHPCCQCFKFTGIVMYNGFSEPPLNVPSTPKEKYLSIYYIQNYLNTHKKTNRYPLTTPYRSSIPINSLPNSILFPADQIIFTHRYQSLSRILSWISTCTQPNLTQDVSFLLSYNHKPSPEHIKVEIYSIQ